MPRIEPLNPPYDDEIATALQKWMPPNSSRDPLRLFRILHRNAGLASRMRPLGAALLAHGALSAQDRELVISRVTARHGAEYEWGVHAAAFGASVGLTDAQIDATVTADPDDEIWGESQQALLTFVDELDGTSTVCDATWGEVALQYSEEQLIELIVLAGWYRTISYLVNALAIENEPWARAFPPAIEGSSDGSPAVFEHRV